MPSLRSQLFNFVLRNRHLLQGKFRKENFDFTTSISDFREQCEKGANRFGKIPDDITIKPEILGGIPAEWLIPQGSDPSKVILYVHGGGYVSGSCQDHRPIISKFAKSTGYQNLIFEYRLAPEHPFPAALEDSVSVYQSLLASGIKP